MWLLNGKKYDCLNLASYNYLGFAEKNSETQDFVLKKLDEYGVSTTSCPLYAGQTELHDELEKCVADFLGVEAAMVFGMGWATNTTAIPALVGKGCLVISDSMNHNSIIVGARNSGSVIRTFAHNDVKELEKIVRRSIIEGQPRTHRPWKKILIIVEGVYSMEGEICRLAEIVQIKKKYKVNFFLFFLLFL
ncbi:serine palmitoyltransferase [Reticulomyxa filosa]|uniref:Serine palmitoyltransferase n=1 Tax=Reticulomyxa filosa TaxID=46433 RepID=X6N0Q0_RETFI|nr:serine palmitoyltransferase [Reticulomyxa filosa]|eukprot:ETO19319.1 serine palmitoyltransferase [Reticulomyxa filosa]